jgi:poly-beta-1,6-N-acetyl-D-glucosamine synthase
MNSNSTDLVVCNPLKASSFNTSGTETHPRIALITPLRDEEDYVEAMILSIIAQQKRPAKWIIVDDGSTDRTSVIVQRYCENFEFIELLELPARSERRPGGEGAIISALERLDLSQFDYLARFDADLLFEKDYFSRLLEEFHQDPKLGIAGGSLFIRKNGMLILEKAPEYHVRGALKMYRRECFEQLGGLGTEIGWDTIDEVYAWSQGWRTRSLSDIQVIHRRPTGEGLHASRIYWERGRAEYLTWSHPAFVFLKTVKLAVDSPANARCFFAGFLRSYKTHQIRLRDSKFKRTRRNQQLARVLLVLNPKALWYLLFK